MKRDMACPHCGRINDHHEAWNKPEPKAGDIGICWKCRKLAVLTVFGFLRKPTAEEAAELAADPDVRRARAAMSEAYTPREAIKLLEDDR